MNTGPHEQASLATAPFQKGPTPVHYGPVPASWRPPPPPRMPAPRMPAQATRMCVPQPRGPYCNLKILLYKTATLLQKPSLLPHILPELHNGPGIPEGMHNNTGHQQLCICRQTQVLLVVGKWHGVAYKHCNLLVVLDNMPYTQQFPRKSSPAIGFHSTHYR